MLSLEGDDPVAIQLRASGRRLAGVAVFSGVINLLTLSGSLYMLQVYDRVIPSRNLATLFGLSAIVMVAYLLQGYFDALRGRMLARIAALFDVQLQTRIHLALVTLALRGTKPILAQQPLRDLDQVRAFLSGAGPTAFLDMPWIPLFLLALFLFHPVIGVIATGGAAAIIAMTFLTERQSKSAAKMSMEGNAQRQVLADALRLDALDEFAGDLEVDVGRKQGGPHLLQGLGHILFGELADSAQVAQGGGQFVGERFEHANPTVELFPLTRQLCCGNAARRIPRSG